MPDKTEDKTAANTEWIEIEDGFAVGDVLRWMENIWSERKFGKKKGNKPKLTGKQQVTGQVDDITEEFITIRIIAAEITENTTAKAREPYKPEQILRKKPQTLLKGKAARLLWEEESSRMIFRTAQAPEKN